MLNASAFYRSLSVLMTFCCLSLSSRLVANNVAVDQYGNGENRPIRGGLSSHGRFFCRLVVALISFCQDRNRTRSTPRQKIPFRDNVSLLFRSFVRVLKLDQPYFTLRFARKKRIRQGRQLFLGESNQSDQSKAKAPTY